MRVCFVTAATANRLHAGMPEAEASRMMGELAPVGVLSLAAVLQGRGCEPEVVDLNRVYYSWLRDSESSGDDFCDFAGALLADHPCDVFGFSTVCSSYPLTIRVAAAVKRARPASLVILGGPQASVVDVSTMRAFPWIDLVVRGEAEEILPELLDALGGSLTNVPGITFRTREQIVRNADGPVIQDLDALPFPAFHLFPDVRSCRHFPLELGRGCPFACSFCSTNDFFRRKFRLKTPVRMIADMRRVRAEYGIASFELVHDMFTVDHKRVEAFCNALIESNEDFTWGCSARTDCIDEELIALMQRAGCRGIFFGIETGSPRMQKIIDKGLNLIDSENRIGSCDKFGINTAVSLMAGFPEETMDDLRATVAFFVDSLRYDHADPQLSILSPLAGTPIQRQNEDSLLLDDALADMSYRGWPQAARDHVLIAAHPEVFSSFYSVRTPNLDHDFLKELRDFLLAGMRAFRRLLLGLHQDSGALEVFQQWRAWRANHGTATADRTAYYAQGAFPSDFFRFVRLHYIPSIAGARASIATLLEFEAAMLADVREPGDRDRGEDVLAPHSRPAVTPGVVIVTVPADYQEIVRRLRLRVPLRDVPVQPVKLAIRRGIDGSVQARQLSPRSAELLDLCGGSLTVQEIAEAYRQKNPADVAGVPPDTFCFAGLEILRQQRLIAPG
jgi:radical SAM superfamily enzyme YgiQ (UPF0313 family)